MVLFGRCRGRDGGEGHTATDALRRFPPKSMPEWLQQVAGGLSVIWPQSLVHALIGATLLRIALARVRKTIGTMA